MIIVDNLRGIEVVMITNDRLRKKKIAIFFIVIALLCGITASLILALNYTPKFFMEIKSHKEEGVKLDYYKTMSHSQSVMVYYPKLDDSIGVTIKNEAEKLYEEILAKEVPVDTKKMYTKVDYTMSSITTDLVNYIFEITTLMDDVENSEIKSIWMNANGEVVDLTTIYDEKVVRMMTQQLRTQCKQDSDLQEIAFSREFLEKTAKIEEVFTNFIVEGTELVFKINHIAPKTIEYRVDLAKVANHILVDFGIEQNVEDEVIYLPERYVDPNRPMVAMTFDDGPHIKNTPPILESLRQYDSAATFYIVGNRINEQSSGVVLETIESGSQVGSHSYSHPNMARMKNIDTELNLTSFKVYEEISKWCVEVTTFRPPYGAISTRMREEAPFPFIMWSIDTEDWQTRNAQVTVDLILDKVQDGDIILMHDIHPESKDAAIQVIPLLIEKGYQIVTVDEMMKAKGIVMENGKAYAKAR